MRSDPRVVFSLPAYNRPESLPETLESILSQTDRDFTVVIVDDSTSESVAQVAEKYARLDRRVIYERNPGRLGMINNWRKCFHRARALYPGSEYFAWVSDHDIWHPRWLETLKGELDAHPEVVLAYPLTLRKYEHSSWRLPGAVDTFGLTEPGDRLRVAARGLKPGDMIYGLFRAAALARAGVFRPLLLPDRQVLLALTLLGQFKLVPEVLWYREVRREFSLERQRAAFFPNGVPFHAHLPWQVTHFATFVWDLALRGRGRPAIGRLAGVRYAGLQLYSSIQRDLDRSRASAVKRKGAASTPLASVDAGHDDAGMADGEGAPRRL